MEAPALQVGWREGRVPHSSHRLPCPRSNGPASGKISHCTSWLLPECGSRRGPSPWPAVSQVGEYWRPGQAEACLLSLPPHRASSSCPAVCKTLAGSSFQRPLPLQPGPVAPGGGLTALASRLFCSHPCLKSGPEPPHRHPRVGGRPQTAGGGPSVGKGLGPGGWESRRRRGPCSQRLSALHTDLHVSRPGLTHGAVTHSSEK